MKMKYYTKVQTTGGSLRTTLPKIVRDLLDIQKGDNLIWTIDTKTEEVTIKKADDE